MNDHELLKKMNIKIDQAYDAGDHTKAASLLDKRDVIEGRIKNKNTAGITRKTVSESRDVSETEVVKTDVGPVNNIKNLKGEDVQVQNIGRSIMIAGISIGLACIGFAILNHNRYTSTDGQIYADSVTGTIYIINRDARRGMIPLVERNE